MRHTTYIADNPVVEEAARSSRPCAPKGCAGLCRHESLAAAYADHSRRMHARAQRVVIDPHLAEEAVQEAFVRAWRACGTFDPTAGPLVNWLLTITTNVAIDMARARSRRPPVVGSDRSERVAAAPAREIDRVLLRDQLRQALARVSDQHRAAIVEIVLRDRAPAEVAAEFGVNPVTLRTRLHYALRQLRMIIGEEAVAA